MEQCESMNAVCEKNSDDKQVCLCSSQHIINEDKTKCLLKGNICKILELLLDINIHPENHALRIEFGVNFFLTELWIRNDSYWIHNCFRMPYYFFQYY